MPKTFIFSTSISRFKVSSEIAQREFVSMEFKPTWPSLGHPMGLCLLRGNAGGDDMTRTTAVRGGLRRTFNLEVRYLVWCTDENVPSVPICHNGAPGYGRCPSQRLHNNCYSNPCQGWFLLGLKKYFEVCPFFACYFEVTNEAFARALRTWYNCVLFKQRLNV